MPALARSSLRTPLRVLLWTLLGGWIGAILLFGAVVARVAFVAIPEPGIAAALVGSVLAPLQLAGIGLGVVLAALGGALGRGWVAIALPVSLGIACAWNHFGVSPALAVIDLADPELGAGGAARFASLHRLSVRLFVGTGIGVVLLAVLHAVWELREERPSRP